MIQSHKSKLLTFMGLEYKKKIYGPFFFFNRFQESITSFIRQQDGGLVLALKMVKLSSMLIELFTDGILLS